jgi:hypothetical protein
MIEQHDVAGASGPGSLPMLEERLASEFGRVPRERINQVVEQAFGDFEDARIRQFVPILAWRTARARLRQSI